MPEADPAFKETNLCRPIVILSMVPSCEPAAQSLEAPDVNVVLPYVPKTAEPELIDVFHKVRRARGDNSDAREVADRFFYETVVRLHRAGEGAPFTGLKPAGLDVGPVIPAAEDALERGSADDLTRLLCDIVRQEVGARFEHTMRLKATAGQGVDAARKYVSAMLGFQVYAHGVYKSLKASQHDGHSHRAEP